MYIQVEESEVGEINCSQVWKVARVNKSGVIDNENVQRVVDQCVSLMLIFWINENVLDLG